MAVLVCAATARAQPESDQADPGEAAAASSPEDANAVRQAAVHFRAGIEHYTAHRYREAVREFVLASQLVPSADLWFNIARSHERLSEYEAAVRYYRLYLRDRVDPEDREAVEARIVDLTERSRVQRVEGRRAPTTGTLRVEANQEGAAIRVAESSVGEAPLAVPLSLEPGRHALEITRDGYIPFRAEVSIVAGVPTGAFADMQAETRYRSIRGSRIWTWIVGGLSVAGIGTSIGLGIFAATRDGRNTQRRLSNLSDVVLGCSLVSLVGAAILYFVEGRSVGTERVSPEGDVLEQLD